MRARRACCPPVAVGAPALVTQSSALVDAKAVLLVDDGQRQILERDHVLDQGVSSDHDIDAAIGQTAVKRLAFGGRGTSRQQPHLHILIF
jgi:hypothetical protein